MPDHILIGWLVIARHQFTGGVECLMPRCISQALIERGWMLACSGEDGCGEWNAHITESGITVTDLNCTEWGINPLPEDSHV